MAREVSRVSVVACLSDFESHGIAVLEALGQGCRAVVARAPGLDALVEAGLARGVDLDAPPEDTAAAILEELALPPLRERPQLTTWEECAEALHSLYRSVARTDPRGR